jgi:hypothetical protein
VLALDDDAVGDCPPDNALLLVLEQAAPSNANTRIAGTPFRSTLKPLMSIPSKNSVGGRFPPDPIAHAGNTSGLEPRPAAGCSNRLAE